MENSIKCPNCKKIIANDPVIDAVAKGERQGTSVVTCDCGERITFWAITAQLRDQQKTGARFQRWVRGIFKK